METKKKNVAHICNLIQMAMRDFHFDDRESQVIMKIAGRLGLSASDIESIVKEDEISIELPDTLPDRIQHLYDFVSVMIADGIIHEEEIKYIAAFTKTYGFEPEITDNILNVKCEELRNTVPFKKFIEEYKKITAEELSSIVVDHDMNIIFPLYNTRLENLGPLPKTIYIFFLMQKDPVHFRNLSDYRALLEKIYMEMLKSRDEAEYRIKNLLENECAINTNRTKINQAIIKSLPKKHDKISDYYIISGARNEPKLVKLNKNLIQIKPKI